VSRATTTGAGVARGGSANHHTTLLDSLAVGHWRTVFAVRNYFAAVANADTVLAVILLAYMRLLVGRIVGCRAAATIVEAKVRNHYGIVDDALLLVVAERIALFGALESTVIAALAVGRILADDFGTLIVFDEVASRTLESAVVTFDTTGHFVVAGKFSAGLGFLTARLAGVGRRVCKEVTCVTSE